MRDYKDLVVWQLAMDVADRVYVVTKSFPPSEVHGIQRQLRRAVVSVASNIAEGSARSGVREYPRFLGYARGSLREAETQTILASRLGFMDAPTVRTLLADFERLSRLLAALRRSLRERADAPSASRRPLPAVRSPSPASH